MMGICPEGCGWKRMPGGYQCNAGGYVIVLFSSFLSSSYCRCGSFSSQKL
jgi:hypothetical protein